MPQSSRVGLWADLIPGFAMIRIRRASRLWRDPTFGR